MNSKIKVIKQDSKFIFNYPNFQNGIINNIYSQKEIVKNLGARWDGRRRTWWIPATEINYALLKKHNSIDISNISENYELNLNKTEKKSVATSKSKTVQYPHQIEMTKFFLEKKRCFFLCGVGTGKTKAFLDSIILLKENNPDLKVLIICPSSVIWNTVKEIEKHTYLEYTLLTGTLRERIYRLKNQRNTIYILNYEILDKMQIELIKTKFDVIILDEIQQVKNRSSNRAMAAYKIAKNIEYRLGCTGTLIANGYQDAFSPFKIINETIFGPYYTQFQNRYLEMGGYNITVNGRKIATEIVGNKNQDEFKKRLKDSSIAYSIEDVAKNMPQEIEKIYEYDLSVQSRKIYDQMKRDSLVEFNNKTLAASNALSRAIKLQQICSGFLKMENNYQDEKNNNKLKQITEILESIGKQKTIIWCKYHRSIDNITELFKKMGVSSCIYDGRTKNKALYHKYNSDDTQVWIGQIQTGVGYELPSARYAVFYELDFSHINHIQSKGRNRRINIQESCVYIYLLAKRTIEPYIFEVIKSKDFIAKDVFQYIKNNL